MELKGYQQGGKIKYFKKLVVLKRSRLLNMYRLDVQGLWDEEVNQKTAIELRFWNKLPNLCLDSP